jgi:dTDP-4-dehydrorhamnose reductase
MLGIDAAAAATRSGHEVLALSRAELDICDPAAVRAAIGDGRPDAVINCAAYTQVDRAQEDADSAARVRQDLGSLRGV